MFGFDNLIFGLKAIETYHDLLHALLRLASAVFGNRAIS